MVEKLMRKSEHEINGKKIIVIDDLFTAKERLTFYNFVYNAPYSLSRIAHDLPEYRNDHKTLKSALSLADILDIGFFQNSFILDFIKTNKLRLRKAYVNLCTAGDTYSYHIDDEEKNSTNVPSLLYYCNLNWEPNWEGETHFADENMKNILFSTSFIPGRIVLFDGSIPHKSSQPSFAAPYYRFVLAVKFSNDSEPLAYNRSLNIEDFVYNTVVELSDKEKELVSYIKEKTIFLKHSGQSFFDHLYNTFLILKSQNLPEDICIAGLFHSIYGTEFYKPNLGINESEIEELIGSRANHLVKCFSENNRYEKILSNYFNLNIEDDLFLTYMLYANEIEQARRIPTNDFTLLSTIRNKIDYLKNE
jgi:hypothetical protein